MGMPIHIVGNITADPELRYTQSGLPVTGFTVAVNERKFNRETNEWTDGDTTFVRCSVWREMAEQVAASLTKGARVMVSGKIALQEYETKDGTKGAALEMQVDEVGPSLRYATAQVQKVAARQGGAPQQGGYQQTPMPGQNPGGWPGQPQQQQPPRGPQQQAPQQPLPWQQPSPNNGPGAMGQGGWAQPQYDNDQPF